MDFSVIRELYHCVENYPFCEEDIQKAIKRFGKLPAVLIDYYRQLGTNTKINQVGDYLYSPANLKLKDGFLFFYVSEQETMWWTIQEKDLYKDNPPVYVCLWENSKFSYILESETLEQFLNAMAYSHALLNLPINSEGDFKCDEEMKRRIEFCYQKKPFCFLATPLTLFYGNDSDEVIRICVGERSMQIAYACTTDIQLNNIQNAIFNNK